MAERNAALGGGMLSNNNIEAPPALYPPRILPKSLRRKPRDNRILLAAQTIEDHLVFSGYRLDDENSTDTRFRFRSIIGKQSIYQELDLDAMLATDNLTAVLTQRVQHEQRLESGHTSDPSSQSNKSRSSFNQSSSSQFAAPSHSQAFDISSNSDLELYGSAMAAFPAELRRFFYKVAEPNNYHPIDHRPSLSRGMSLYRRYTNLGPFAPMDKTLPVRYSHHYDRTKTKILTEAFNQLTRTFHIQFTSRYQTRYVNPPPSLAARAQKQKQLQAAKLKKMLKKESKAAGRLDDDDDDDDDDDTEVITKNGKRANQTKRRTTGGSDNDDDDNEAGDDSVSDADSSEESELDFDMGEVHDDDDDDYGRGDSGDDEPTF